MLVAAPARAADPPLDLEGVSVSDLQTKMAAGQLTSVQLTRAYINRIAAVNARGPGINAVRLVNPRALQDASLLDLERTTGRVRGPLHGIPVLVKDNLDVAGLPTTAGNVALQNSIPDKDSAVVANLRKAGAVILGKTNLSEFANFLTTGNPAMPSGYSSLGGQLLNPYDIDATPSGSSSGSAAAAAGSLPISATQDTAGPITRTVADAAAELQAIAGKDTEDPATAGAPGTRPDH